MNDFLMLPAPKAHFRIVQKHKIYIWIGVAISFFIVILSLSVATTQTSWKGRAENLGASGILSRENSYLFASPISAESDGKSSIRITVFLLTTEGMGIASEQVILKSSDPLTTTEVQPVSDTFGRALFDVTSTNQGSYTITAEVQGVPLPQTVSIVFR